MRRGASICILNTPNRQPDSSHAALKPYGMILADNGSAWFITGTPDHRWNDDDLHKLQQVSGSNFEAVDESDWQMIPSSARVDPTVP